MSTAQVAEVLQVHSDALARWVAAGLLHRAPGRPGSNPLACWYLRSGVESLLGGPVEPLLTPSQAADLFGVKVRRLREWAGEGLLSRVSLPSERGSGLWRYRRSEVETLRAQMGGGDDLSDLLSPGEAGEILGVNWEQVTRWARGGRLRYSMTPMGHRRYALADVEAFKVNRYATGHFAPPHRRNKPQGTAGS